MKAFADLYTELEEATHGEDKVSILFRYFTQAPDEDASWVVALIKGDRLKRSMSRSTFLDIARTVASLPDWLFEASLDAVMDQSETVALILPEPNFAEESTQSLAWWIENRIKHLPHLDAPQKEQVLREAWAMLPSSQRLVFNKLVRGTIRLRADAKHLISALSMLSGVSTTELTHRLSGAWIPEPNSYQALITPESNDFLTSRPYPFRYPSERASDRKDLGLVAKWRVEWKWNGKRAQIIRRSGKSTVWLKGEQLVQDQFPELIELGDLLPNGCVIDGEILAWKEGQPESTTTLDKRLTRAPKPKDRKELPITFVAFDLLELNGIDLRERPLVERLSQLQKVMDGLQQLGADGIPSHPGVMDIRPNLHLSISIGAESWSEVSGAVQRARDLRVEGVIIKRLESAYDEDMSDWQKWLCEPLQIDVVLMYVEWVGGRNGTEECHYTVGLWKGRVLVPIAKARANLSNSEIHAINAFVRENTLEKFGPVRTVKPEIVMRLEFDAIQASTRTKSGLSLKGPRIIKWHSNLTSGDVPDLDVLVNLLPS